MLESMHWSLLAQMQSERGGVDLQEEGSTWGCPKLGKNEPVMGSVSVWKAACDADGSSLSSGTSPQGGEGEEKDLIQDSECHIWSSMIWGFLFWFGLRNSLDAKKLFFRVQWTMVVFG